MTGGKKQPHQGGGWRKIRRMAGPALQVASLVVNIARLIHEWWLR